MTSPRSSRSLYVVLAALLILLPLLAILQYGWIGTVTEAERSHLEEHLQQSGIQFTNDFDRELNRFLNTFQVRGALDREDISDWFAQRYDDSNATYPNLVKRVFLIRRTNSELSLLQLSPEQRALETMAWTDELEPVKEAIESRLERAGRQRTSTPSEALSNGDPVFIVPAMPDGLRNGLGRNPFEQRNGLERPRGPRAFERAGQAGGGTGPTTSLQAGFSLVELNPKVLYNEFTPTIVARHFPTGPTAEYRVAIVTAGSNPHVIYKSDIAYTDLEMQKPDLRIPLFGPEPGGRFRPNPAVGVQDVQQRGSGRPQFTGFSGNAIVGMPGFITVMRGLALTGDWELLVTHRSGSVNAAIAAARHKDLAVAFSVLLMLALSVVLVVVLSHRTRALAQLQMDFVARVSHELRTPLAIIRSAAYNLATGIVSDEQGIRDYATMVQAEGQRLSTMVDQILAFSRTQSGRDAYDLRPIEVDEIVDRVMSNMSAALNAAGCAVDRRISVDLPRVKADERAFAECLQNLVANAIKYGRTEHAARIELEARREGSDTVIVSVADSGPGIDSADLEHIFEPFFRGKNASSDTPGSGLGLNLVSRMMNAQGGRVTVESEPGRGTRFSLHLSTVSEALS